MLPGRSGVDGTMDPGTLIGVAEPSQLAWQSGGVPWVNIAEMSLVHMSLGFVPCSRPSRPVSSRSHCT